MELLRSRTTVPYIRNFPDDPDNARLIILPGEDSPSTPSTARGRPVGPAYYDIEVKLSFMDTHAIAASVISLANPWLDFLAPADAVPAATAINAELDALCAQHPGRLFAFGALPLSASPHAVADEVQRIAQLPRLRGVIMGTAGLGQGQGLDDPALDPVWAALQKARLPVFLHPHYGLPAEVWGPRATDYGHVLPLALGFPLETTIAVTRMLLAGVWDRFEGLSVLLAHSGGALPFLAGRIESCIAHDEFLSREGRRNKRSVWDVLRTNVFLDAVVYSDVGLGAAVAVSGADRLMFGTDHPFFPPLGKDDDADTDAADSQQWQSVQTNYAAINATFAHDEAGKQAVLGGNAIRVLGLEGVPA
ncbi:uncharacterized protein K452DRAFT_288858, partial [Aplosporella prunicola CBS 121167]